MSRIILFAFMLLNHSIALADAAMEAFEKEAASQRHLRDEWKISELEQAKDRLALFKKHAPDQHETHALMAYRVVLETQLQEKQISQAELDSKWEERQNQLGASLQPERVQLLLETQLQEKQISQAELDSKWEERQNQLGASLQPERVQQQAYEQDAANARRGAAIGMEVQNFSNFIRLQGNSW